MEYQRAYAKIDLDAIEHNIALVKQKISANTKLMLVVKADAYGHGAVMIAKEFEKIADYLGVAEINEALELRAAGIKKPCIYGGYRQRYYKAAYRAFPKGAFFRNILCGSSHGR